MLLSTMILAGLLTSPAPAAAKPATNGRCPVLANPVGDRNQTVEVRGRKYRICCDDCGAELSKNPEKFLLEDGTPRNAAKGSSGGSVRDHY